MPAEGILQGASHGPRAGRLARLDSPSMTRGCAARARLAPPLHTRMGVSALNEASLRSFLRSSLGSRRGRTALLVAAALGVATGCSAPIEEDEAGGGAAAATASSFDQPKTIRAAAEGVVVVDRASLWFLPGGLSGTPQRIHHKPQVRDRSGQVESHQQPRVIGDRVYWYAPQAGEQPGSGNAPHLVSVRLDGSGEVDLGPATLGSLASSGDVVAFANQGNVMLAKDGGTPRKIASTPGDCTLKGLAMNPASADAVYVATSCTTAGGARVTIVRMVEDLAATSPKTTPLQALAENDTFTALAGADAANAYVLQRSADETTSLLRVPRSGAPSSRVATVSEKNPLGLRQEGERAFYWSVDPGRREANMACSIAFATGQQECVGHAQLEADPANNEVVQNLSYELFFEPGARRPVTYALRRKGPAMPTFHRVEVGLSR